MLTNTDLSSDHLMELELKSEDTHTHKTHPSLHPDRIQTALRESDFLLGHEFNAFQLKFERLQYFPPYSESERPKLCHLR
jgi:hypothetical protein